MTIDCRNTEPRLLYRRRGSVCRASRRLPGSEIEVYPKIAFPGYALVAHHQCELSRKCVLDANIRRYVRSNSSVRSRRDVGQNTVALQPGGQRLNQTSS